MLTGGFFAGLFDITYACTFHFFNSGAMPTRIFQAVAAGLLGRKASFAGGASTAALGLVLHFFVALSISFIYYGVARKWPFLWKQWLLCGALYGLVVFGVMNYVVIPLSATSGGSNGLLWLVLSILVHMFLIGVPVAYFVRRALV